jgi:hypothetical protein
MARVEAPWPAMGSSLERNGKGKGRGGEGVQLWGSHGEGRAAGGAAWGLGLLLCCLLHSVREEEEEEREKKKKRKEKKRKKRKKYENFSKHENFRGEK